MPTDIERMGVEFHYSMKSGLKDVDIVMMLRLQTERMQGLFVPSISEYFRFFGLDHEKLEFAKPDALIMHPGPMNRGVEIDSEVADDIDRSVIHEQVEMGVAVRMACLEALIGGRRNAVERRRSRTTHDGQRRRARRSRRIDRLHQRPHHRSDWATPNIAAPC